MSFVRLFINKRTGEIEHVMEQDVPFRGGGFIKVQGEEHEMRDLGYVEEHDWRDENGKPTTPSKHIFLRYEDQTRDDMPVVHDCPCSIEGIKARLRARGPAGIPTKVRAWLANVLPEHEVEAFGIGRGLPISALKAAEAIRNRRDPQGGSRMSYFEGIAQRQADAHAAARLRKRNKKKEAP